MIKCTKYGQTFAGRIFDNGQSFDQSWTIFGTEEDACVPTDLFIFKFRKTDHITGYKVFKKLHIVILL